MSLRPSCVISTGGLYRDVTPAIRRAVSSVHHWFLQLNVDPTPQQRANVCEESQKVQHSYVKWEISDKHCVQTCRVELTVEVWQDFVLGCGVLGCQACLTCCSRRHTVLIDIGYIILLAFVFSKINRVVCVSVRTYCRRVVSERLQVSHVGVNEPPSAFDLWADVVVCGESNENSHTEKHMQDRLVRLRAVQWPHFNSREQHSYIMGTPALWVLILAHWRFTFALHS